MVMSTAGGPAFPCPFFEGSEKRLELHFRQTEYPQKNSSSPLQDLRSMSRESLDYLMQLAACEIISCKYNSVLDAYVLSESSLFVRSRSVVLKTCGTTKPLACIQALLTMAAQLGLEPSYVKYSRASYLAPGLQVPEYQEFSSEIELLQKHLGHLGNGGSAFQLGDKLYGLQWHIFVASDQEHFYSNQADAEYDSDGCGPAISSPTGSDDKDSTEVPYTLEICMTELDSDAAKAFVRTPEFVSSAYTTSATGISDIVPGADIDDYVFEPCGYSMNGVLGPLHITIHVTPEEGFSYASCEVQGVSNSVPDLSEIVSAAATIFQPGRMVAACTMPCCFSPPIPILVPGYGRISSTLQDMPSGDVLLFKSFVRETYRKKNKCCPSFLSSLPSFIGSMSHIRSMDLCAEALSGEVVHPRTLASPKPLSRESMTTDSASSASDDCNDA